MWQIESNNSSSDSLINNFFILDLVTEFLVQCGVERVSKVSSLHSKNPLELMGEEATLMNMES